MRRRVGRRAGRRKSVCVHVCVGVCMCVWGGQRRKGGRREGVGEYNDKEVGIANSILVIQVRGERRYIRTCM